MKALLDTHTFLWWITGAVSVSRRASEIIGDGSNLLFLSAASGWEIAIKAQLGKLTLPAHPNQFVTEQLAINGIDALPIQLIHAMHVYTLPLHHRDPFDRILIAQSQLENLPILTADPLMARYAVDIIW